MAAIRRRKSAIASSGMSSRKGRMSLSLDMFSTCRVGSTGAGGAGGLAPAQLRTGPATGGPKHDFALGSGPAY
ncbi:hypothetical protein JNW89_04230 [Micromonospora sp. 4G55]|nr:hypothetical protein [Micromonospora sp. 4G55]